MDWMRDMRRRGLFNGLIFLHSVLLGCVRFNGRLKGRHVNSPCDEAGTILLNRVGERISPKKKGERGVSMNCKIGGVKGKRGLGAPGGGEGKGGETVK